MGIFILCKLKVLWLPELFWYLVIKDWLYCGLLEI